MKVLGHNIYANFEVIPTKYEKKVRAVIIGQCGNGKTSFINRLCNTTHQTGIRQNSLTRDIECEDVLLPRAPSGLFLIADTPGSDSNQLAMEHARVIRKTLEFSYNLILIQSKLDQRFELNTLPSLLNILKVFQGYQQNIVFLISHIDKLDNIPKNEVNNKSQILDQIQNCFVKHELKVKYILYSNKNSDPNKLAQILYSVGSKNEIKNIKISDKKFYKYFKIQDINEKAPLPKVQKYLQQIDDIADLYKDFLKNLSVGDPQNDDLIADLKAHMRYDLKTTQWRQFELYQKKLQEQTAGDLYLMISQRIQRYLENFDNQSALKLLKQYYYEYDCKNYDIRDLFKMCPHCKMIWMRSDGCDGMTFCGMKPDFFDFFKQKKQWKYKFIREGQQLKCIKGELKNVSQMQVEEHQLKTMKKSKKQVEIKDQGCGEQIKWRQLPRLDKIEKLLYELYGISNYEEIKSDQDFIRKISTQRFQRIDERVELNRLKLQKKHRI